VAVCSASNASVTWTEARLGSSGKMARTMCTMRAQVRSCSPEDDFYGWLGVCPPRPSACTIYSHGGAGNADRAQPISRAREAAARCANVLAAGGKHHLWARTGNRRRQTLMGR
jgi:hypothetical protein